MNYADYYRPPKAKRPTYSQGTPYMQQPQNFLHAMPSGSYNPGRYQGLPGWGRQGGGMNYQQPPMGNGFQSYYQPPYGRPNSMYGRPSGQNGYGGMYGGGAYARILNPDGTSQRATEMPFYQQPSPWTNL